MDDMKRSLLVLLDRFDTGMLCTRQPDGTMRARPMALAQVEESGDLWFVTGVGSGKVEEVLNDPHVVVTFQGRKQFASISGRAEIVGDEERIEALWRDEWGEWFPQGKDDPRLALLHVRATEAEWWDESVARGAKHALDAAKAALSGKQRRGDEEREHGHLML
ncbi:MAG: pyridoxamine 5'-phosphate oxidase family protein [Sandaracinaceae bacterium]|nr:pyridoxamine 5'-phosphate oxidase family protein [Sandaracinaceae bacterium]